MSNQDDGLFRPVVSFNLFRNLPQVFNQSSGISWNRAGRWIPSMRIGHSKCFKLLHIIAEIVSNQVGQLVHDAVYKNDVLPLQLLLEVLRKVSVPIGKL